jgi:hypothetical protein
MKLSAILLLLITGCTSADDPGYPIETPGGPGNGGGGTSSSASRVTGRVCVLADPTLMSACAITGASGLSVSMGTAATTTNADGSFTLESTDPVSPTTNLAITGTGIVPSQTTVNATNIVPVMNQQLFDNMVLATGISPEPQTGTIIASVVNGQGVPAMGVTATSLPTGTVGPFFDGTGATPFTLDETGARGVVMFPNVATGAPTSLTFNSGQDQESTVDGVQVVDGGITFVDAALP